MARATTLTFIANIRTDARRIFCMHAGASRGAYGMSPPVLAGFWSVRRGLMHRSSQYIIWAALFGKKFGLGCGSPGLLRRGHAQMRPSFLRQHPAARGALDQTLLQKIGFNHLFKRVPTLA